MTQLSYSLDQAMAFAGLKAHSTTPQEVLSYIAEGAIPIGRAVALGTDPERQVLSPAADGTFLGVALHDHARESQRDANPASYVDQATVSVMTKGAVWVEVSDTVVAGNAAHYNVTDGRFTQPGGTTPSTNAVGTWQTGASADGLAILILATEIL